MKIWDLIEDARLIPWPQEVSELTKVKIIKSSILTYRNVIYLKRSLIKIVTHIWTKIKGFWVEKIEKKMVSAKFQKKL